MFGDENIIELKVDDSNIFIGQIKIDVNRFDLPSFFSPILQSITPQTRSTNKSIIP